MRHVGQNANDDHDSDKWISLESFSEDEHNKEQDDGDDECDHVEVFENKVQNFEGVRVELFL